MRTISEIFEISHEIPIHMRGNGALKSGDLVMVGANHGPVYEIIHIHCEHAWLRPLRCGQEGLTTLASLRPAWDQ
jgi:hypothetical protein